MFTLKDVEEIFKELDAKTGLHGADLEVFKVNDNYSLGSFEMRGGYDSGIPIHPHHFEFSSIILDKMNGYEKFRDMVVAMYCHYVATVRHQDDCGNDERFVEVCYELADNEEQAKRLIQPCEIDDEVNSKWEHYVKTCQDMLLNNMEFEVDYEAKKIIGHIHNNSEDVTMEHLNIYINTAEKGSEFPSMSDYESLKNIKPKETGTFEIDLNEFLNIDNIKYIELRMDFEWYKVVRPVMIKLNKRNKFNGKARVMTKDLYNHVFESYYGIW